MRLSLLFAALLLCSAGCAAAPVVSAPLQQSVPVPRSTRVLGQATQYFSATGEKLEVVHDDRTGVAIVKLPDEQLAILTAEIAGTEGRYRDDRLTLWETEGSALLWLDGKLVFSGNIAK